MSGFLHIGVPLSSVTEAEMMQRSSVLCSISCNLLPSSPVGSFPLIRRSRGVLYPLLSPSSTLQLRAERRWNRHSGISCPRGSATQEAVETSRGTVESSQWEDEYVEIGFISRVHGLQGEICVKPTTDFPELRFCKPGKRWLKQQVSGRDMIQEIELVDGRGHPGQKSWILKFEGIDTVHEAEQIIGSTLLVMETDRPDLDPGEFYTRDLVGMRVIHKDTAEVIGTVVNVYNSGAGDLLHVQLGSPACTYDGTGKPKAEETVDSVRLIWVPFVEAIVPDVDMNRREMFITPPKGLLELNLRSSTVSKKERRQLEWKERKKFQKRLIAAKKKLSELEQQHVFHGFRFGDKTQGKLLGDQIVRVNSKLLEQALQNIQISSERIDVAKFLSGTRSKIPAATLEKHGANFAFQENGNRLISGGKVAIALVVNDRERLDISNCDLVLEKLIQILRCDDQNLVKVEARGSVPLILISPSHQIPHLESLFLENDYFAFDSNKVWFLEEEMLPVVDSSTEKQIRHKILMKSPWEILQSPVGSGGIISSLSSHHMPEILTELGVEYVRVCCTNRVSVGAQEPLLGFVKSKDAMIGIQFSDETGYSEESFDIVFSLSHLNKLVKLMDRVQFLAIPRTSSHVELFEKQWLDVVPSSPNSYELRTSLYSYLNFCSPDKVCLLEIGE